MSELVGPGVVGLPYLTFYHEDGFTCFRAGKTGEYGYDLLVPREGVAALETQIQEVGRRFDLDPIDLDTLDQCALENWFFNIRREGSSGATPLELQLQWRVAYDRDYPGAAALRALRARGPTQRLTCLLADAAVGLGDPVLDGARVIGRVVNAGHSPLRGDWVVLALLDRDLAHAGLAGLTVRRDGAEVAVRTTTPPVIDNLSLFVQPQRHSYHTRAEHPLPGQA
jgi:glycine cleavage system aminomethyltransferase T